MNFKSLLFSAFAAGFAMSANAYEISIIEDGKLASGLEVLDGKEVLEYAEGTAPDGTPAASFTLTQGYTECRIYNPEGFDLNKAWNVEVEYYFEEMDESVFNQAFSSKWSMIDCFLIPDTTGNQYSRDNSINRTSLDVKTNHQAGVWNKDTRFIYASNAITTNPKLFIFDWAYEFNGLEDVVKPLYVKSLKLVSGYHEMGDNEQTSLETPKPYYYEDFSRIGGNTVSNDGADNFNKYVITGGEVTENGSYSGAPEKFVCTEGEFYTVQHELDTKGKILSPGTLRLWEETGTDGNAYFLDAENFHGLEEMKISGSAKTIKGSPRTFVLIPNDATAKEWDLTFIAKWSAKRISEGLNENTSKDSLELPIYFGLVDSPLDCAGDMTAFTKVADSLPAVWTRMHAHHLKADATKKYIAIIFETPQYFSYVVDNIQLYKDYTADVEVVEADNKAVVTVEGGVATVADAESLSVYNSLGALVATSNTNSVNVENLAKGVYVVVTNTKASAKIVVK